jgi:thiol-disulfide isomerase/thioredoxin
MKARHLVSLIAFALAFPTSGLAIQREQTSEKIEWRRIAECIAGTPISHRRAARKLGFDRGRWVVAYFSAYCSDCDKAAVELNKTAQVERVLAVTIAPAESARKWKLELGLEYPVISVSEKTFEDLGAVILPTLVLFEDGEAKGAYTPSIGEKK